MNTAAIKIFSLIRPALNIQARRFQSAWKLMHYYNTLKARPDYSPEEIRANYLELVKVYHPDNLNTGDPRKFMRIQESYDKIKAAPLWQKGNTGDESVTHEELIKTRTINKYEHKYVTKYTIRHFSHKLYKIR